MTINSTRHEQIGAFFLANASRLRTAVARHARGSLDIVDDACAIAWGKLVRRPDVTLDARGFSWLTTVAMHEAWRLHRATAAETPVGTFQADSRLDDNEESFEPRDRVSDGTEERALDRVQHSKDLEAFNTLKPREKQALYLKGLGYTYDEISELMGFTYTAVNRYITEGRRALRRGGYTPDDQARHVRAPRHPEIRVHPSH